MKRNCFILVLVLLFFVTGCHNKETLSTPVTLFFLACEDADVTIIKQQNHVIMIDTGESTCKKNVMSFLENHQIETIELLVLTHPDKDHIGNAYDIINSYKVEHILAPDYQKGSELEQELLQLIQKRSIFYQVLKQQESYQIGEMELIVVPPNKQYDSSNNSSLIAWLKTGAITTFFGADIKRKRIEELTDIKSAQLVKLPYHGRYISNLNELLKALDPEYIIIPTKEIEAETKQLLEQMRYSYEKTPVIIEIDGKTWKKR